MSNIQTQNADHLFMIAQAVKAPSGHNTQPWLFKPDQDKIEIHPNLKRSLPVVDPDNRELLISLGCATENLCIAAASKGYISKAVIAYNGVITIHLEKNEQVKYDSLFEQIAVRQTNRSKYKGTSIPASTLQKLGKVPLERGIDIHFYENGSKECKHSAYHVLC